MSDDNRLLDSNYDGIEEYDNDLPRWWVYLFYITIVFGIGYWAYYQFGYGQTQKEILAQQMKEIESLRAKAEASSGGQADESTLLALAVNQGAVANGKTVFQTRCVVCHGQSGEGVVGPNLTDKYWIHGGKITDIHKVVENGVLDKGMLAWKGVLSSEELNSVVAFVWSLKGTAPANPKAPQGDLVE